MQFKQISQLPEAASIDNSSLFAVQNGADTKKVSYQTLVDQLKKDGIGGGRGRFSQDFTIVLKRQTDPITTPCSVELFTKDAYMLYVKIRLPGELNFTKLGDGQVARYLISSKWNDCLCIVLPKGAQISLSEVSTSAEVYMRYSVDYVEKLAYTSAVVNTNIAFDPITSSTKTGTREVRLVDLGNGKSIGLKFSLDTNHVTYIGIANNSSNTVKIRFPNGIEIHSKTTGGKSSTFLLKPQVKTIRGGSSLSLSIMGVSGSRYIYNNTLYFRESPLELDYFTI